MKKILLVVLIALRVSAADPVAANCANATLHQYLVPGFSCLVPLHGVSVVYSNFRLTGGVAPESILVTVVQSAAMGLAGFKFQYRNSTNPVFPADFNANFTATASFPPVPATSKSIWLNNFYYPTSIEWGLLDVFAVLQL